uniref:Uncharacterized protein n=1 Tax=Oryza nivara TaxID=4536 RepID=A0A0E0I5C4_ORYNI
MVAAGQGAKPELSMPAGAKLLSPPFRPSYSLPLPSSTLPGCAMLGNTLRRRHRGRSTTGAPTPCLPLSLSVVIREEETEKEKEAGRRKKKKEREEGTDSGPYFYKPPWNFMPSMGTLVWSDDPDVELKVVKPDMTYSSGRSVALRTPRLNAYSGRSLATPSTSTIRRTLRCPVIVLPAATSSAPIAARLCQAPPRDRPLQLNHCSSQIQEPPRLRDRCRSSATRLRPSSTRTDELLRPHARRSLRPSYWEPDGTNIRAKLHSNPPSVTKYWHATCSGVNKNLLKKEYVMAKQRPKVIWVEGRRLRPPLSWLLALNHLIQLLLLSNME